MSDAVLEIPWEPWPHGWRLGTSDNWAAFDTEGIHVLASPGGTQDIRWRDVLGLTISIGRHSKARDLWEIVTPRPTSGLAFSGTIELGLQLSRRDLDLTLPMTGPCSWQVAFVLQDLLGTLKGERLHLTGRPGLVDGVVNEVAGRVRPWSRLLIDADLLGLDRFVGGHGAYHRAIETAVARHS